MVIYHRTAFVAAGYGDWGIYALSVSTGKQLWYDQLADYTDYSPVILDKTLIVASRDGQAIGINPGSGKIVWCTNLHGVPFAQPTVDGKSVIIKVGDHRLVMVNGQSGKIIWVYHTSAVITSPVVENRKFAQSMPGMAGMPAMRMPMVSSPAAGTVYIGTSSGKVLALN